MVRLDGAVLRAVFSLIAGDARSRSSRHAARQLIAAGGALAVDGAGVCRSYSCGSSSPLSTALCSRLVGGNCWRRQPAARCVMKIDSLCCEPRSRCRWRWRLKRLLVRLFIIVAVCFVFSTRRRRWLAMPVRRWVRHSIRDEARQLVAADDTLAVDDRSVCGSYSMARHRRR